MLLNQVGDIRGVVVLDKEGGVLISKYYNAPDLTHAKMEEFNQRLHKKKSRFTDSSMYHNNFFSIDHFVAFFREYDDLSVFVLGTQNDNELILSDVLDTIHEVLDTCFARGINRKSLTENMVKVILTIDELVDEGIILTTELDEILDRINHQGGSHSTTTATVESTQAQDAPQEAAGYSFSSVFSSAKSSLAKTLAL